MFHRSVLLLEQRILGGERVLRTLEVAQSPLKDGASTIDLLAPNFELRELEVPATSPSRNDYRSSSMFSSDSSFIARSKIDRQLALLPFRSSHLAYLMYDLLCITRYPYRLLRDLVDHPFVELAHVVHLSAPLFELDVGEPRLLVGEGLHPALENSAGRDDVSDVLLKIGEFIPFKRRQRRHTRVDRHEGGSSQLGRKRYGRD